MDIYKNIKNKLSKLPRRINLNPNYKLLEKEESIKYENEDSKFILVNEKTNKYILVTEREAFIWKELRENSEFENLVYKYFDRYRKLGIEFIDSVVYRWSKLGLVLSNDLYSYVDDKKQESISKSIVKTTSNIFHFEINISLLSKTINLFYRLVKRFLKLKNISIIIILASISNIVFFGYIILNPTIMTHKQNGSLIFVAIVFSMISLFLHEAAHGFAMNHFGLNVKRSGFKFYYGIPTFFVDSSAIWLKSKKSRIIVTSAGIIMNWVLSGVAFSMYILLGGYLDSTLLLQFAFINLTYALLNLIPFIELDGYYIAIDLFDSPNLKNKSLKVFNSFISGKELGKNELVYLVFSILTILTLIIFLVLTIYIGYNNYLEITYIIK